MRGWRRITSRCFARARVIPDDELWKELADGMPRGLPGDPPDPRDLPAGCPFHPRCPVAVPECERLDVRLRAAGPGRVAACVHVGTPSALEVVQ